MALISWRPSRPGWGRKDPLDQLTSLQQEMNTLWGSLFGEPAARGFRSSGVFPGLNLSEDEENIYVRAEVPGISPDDLEITTQDNDLVIKGERKISAEGAEVAYHRREREAGRFQRIATLPVRFDPGRVQAVCKDGILTITLAKAPEARPTTIRVQSA